MIASLLSLLSALLFFLILPFMFIFFWALDAGRTIFFATLLGIPSMLLLVTLFFFLKRKRRKVFLSLFFISLFFLADCLFFLYAIGMINTLFTNRTYHPAIGPRNGVKIYTIDYPRKRLDNIYRIAAVSLEGKGEKYVIQGWLNDNTLVYKKWQGWTYVGGFETTIGLVQVLQYDLITKTSSFFSGKTEALEDKTCEYKACIKDLISTPNYPHGCSIGYPSPNGKRVACIAMHMYGPQDIIILER